MNSVAFISHAAFLQHEMGPHHPESPARLYAINDQLIASGIDPLLYHRDALPAGREQLLRVHDAGYIDEVFAASPAEGLAWLDGDTAMNPHSLEAALLAAGANVLAVDMVMSGQTKRAFCSVRPPGHHAERDRAMGFCIFNNVAVGAAHAIAEHGVERVAIVDFDVHHGNGTEDIFSGDSRVLLCSTFQYPFYPGTGVGETAANIVNCPLPAMTEGADFRAAVRAHWLPALEAFAPQLVMVSAGFDAHVEDDMAQLNLREPDYEWITLEICELADRYAGGRIVSTLEGGYNLSALGRSVVVHLRTMMDYR
ncbi:MAG: histone deacetylase family protein [Gammaproteobacteria bacterium]|jgi:acetoin utilization deacetylase AcuC-like enzyme